MESPATHIHNQQIVLATQTQPSCLTSCSLRISGYTH
uniref:Uncharacterized protein n=1 Tax=Arundo donax TaxID=35708 RepID=A0A0A9BJ01_ARUDO